MTRFITARHGGGLGFVEQTRMRFISGTAAQRLVGSVKVSYTKADKREVV